MSTCEHFELVKQYANVCSQALLENKDRFPFKQILGAAQKAELERPIEVVIEDVSPREFYVFFLREHGLDVKPLIFCRAYECVRSWRTNMQYLKTVTHNTQLFLDNPAKLDWGWMYDS